MQQARSDLDGEIITFMLLVHGLALWGLLHPGWRLSWLAAAATVYVVAGIGTTVGLHRLICHRSFKCPLWVEHALVTAAMITGQGSPLLWAATHRRHHARSDQAGDPHTPKDSFWYGHIGWIWHRSSSTPEEWRRWCKDLIPDRYYHFLLRGRLVPHLCVAVAMGLTLGWEALPSCLYLPMVLWMHATYSVNSFGHSPNWGRAPFATGELSRNVPWVGLAALGEGWHNNHHAFPASARHGLLAGQFDASWLVIRALMSVGLASCPKLPDPERIAASRRDGRQGDR